jgi:hypothetical protein
MLGQAARQPGVNGAEHLQTRLVAANSTTSASEVGDDTEHSSSSSPSSFVVNILVNVADDATGRGGTWTANRRAVGWWCAARSAGSAHVAWADLVQRFSSDSRLALRMSGKSPPLPNTTKYNQVLVDDGQLRLHRL